MIKIPKEIFHSKAISLPEVRNLLLKRAAEGNELSYMQRIALEHAHLTSRISAESSVKLVHDLIETFRISDKGAITIANYMPDNIHELRQLLGKEASDKETETLEKLIEMILSIERLDEGQKEKELKDLDNAEEDEEDEKVVDESIIPEDLA
ncbi:MAG: hypothetical protein OEZ01_04050 [Candidatus Heimdallarchaeota archaeon]|nr:hypothetical protein [Candidatus Heimdallarchaeota archaeon]MDH5645152.1 hypothetical protein [Candidatus Heimdallarchaeota archaeon]